MNKIFFLVCAAVVITSAVGAPSYCAMSEKEKLTKIASAETDLEFINSNIVGYPLKTDGERKEMVEKCSEAINILKSVAAEYPNDYDVNSKLGVASFDGSMLDIPGAWTDSVYYLTKAAQLKPDSFPDYNLLAATYADKKLHSRAIQNYFRALNYAADDTERGLVYQDICVPFSLIGDAWSAYYYAGKALDLDPKNEKLAGAREDYKQRIFDSIPVKIGVSDDKLAYTNDMFKFEIVFPLDWDICGDSFDGDLADANRNSCRLDLALPQTVESYGTVQDNIFSIHVFAVRGTLEKMAKVVHKEMGMLVTDLKEVKEPLMNGAKEYTFSTFDNGRMRKVYEVYFGETDGLKYLLYHSAVAAKFDEGQKSFKEFIKMVKVTQ